jgi:hypothetical protein
MALGDSTNPVYTVADSSAVGFAKAEDAVHASGDVGVFTLGVRRDGPTLSTQASAAGDYSEFAVDNAGAQYFRPRPLLFSRVTADGQVKASAGYIHTVTISGTTATPTAGLLTIYDSLTETGTVIFSGWVAASVTPLTITLDIATATGIFIGFDATLAGVSVTTSYI